MNKLIETGIKSELKIHPKWNYAAKDRDGRWYLYTSKPYTTTADLWRNDTGNSEELKGCNLDFNGPWRESLHKIREGMFLRIKEVWVPKKNTKVMVSGNEGQTFLRRYSTGKLDKNGYLLCYREGHTDWTAEMNCHPWEHWRKPTKEELKSNIPLHE